MDILVYSEPIVTVDLRVGLTQVGCQMVELVDFDRPTNVNVFYDIRRLL